MVARLTYLPARSRGRSNRKLRRGSRVHMLFTRKGVGVPAVEQGLDVGTNQSASWRAAQADYRARALLLLFQTPGGSGFLGGLRGLVSGQEVPDCRD